MSSTSRTDVERRKEEAQRLRANQASMSQANAVPEEPLFEAPRKIDQTQRDHSARKIKEILGSWEKFHWAQEKSLENPVKKASVASKAVTSAVTSSRGPHSLEPSSLHSQPAQNFPHVRLNGEQKKDVANSRREEFSELGLSSRNRCHQSSSKSASEENQRSEVLVAPRELGINSGSSWYSNSSHVNRSISNSGASAVMATQSGKLSSLSPLDGLQGTSSSKVRQSCTPPGKHGSGQQSVPCSVTEYHQSKVPSSHRPKTAELPKADDKPATVSHLESASPYHGTHRASLLNHNSPALRTPPSHRTPPQRQLPAEDISSKSACNPHVPSKPNLTVQIKQEKIKEEVLEKINDLENIFKEMTDLQPPHTGIQTPVKMNIDRFPFPTLPKEMEDEVKPKQEGRLSTESDAHSGSKPLSETASVSADLDVSEDSDEEDEKPPRVATNPAAEKERFIRSHAPTKPLMLTSHEESAGHASSMSSSDDSSSESDSSSEGGSESDSSASETGEVHDEEEGEIQEDSKKEAVKDEQSSVPSPSKENSQSGWSLSRFMPPNKQSSPATRTGIENGVGKASNKGDFTKTKSSPRKIGEIGPCNSMPFVPHEDLQHRRDLTPVSTHRAEIDVSCNVPKAASTSDADRSGSKHKKTTSDEKDRPAADCKDRSPSGIENTVISLASVPKPQCGESLTFIGSSKVKRTVSNRVTSESQQGERKRKIADSELTTQSKTEPPKSPSSESDVDIESVTPEPKALAATSASVSKLKKQLMSVTKQLFGPPTARAEDSCAHSDNNSSVPHKFKSTHRKDDSSRSSKAERKHLGATNIASAKFSTKPPSDSGSHIANIFKETTKEFQPLSPIESSTTPQKKEEEGWSHSPLHIPAATCGKPSIVVRLPMLSLSNSCKLRHVSSSADYTRTEGRTAAVRGDPRTSTDALHNTSVSVCQSAATAMCVQRSSQDISEPSVAGKNSTDVQIPSHPPYFIDSSPSKLPSVKRKKEPDGGDVNKRHRPSNASSVRSTGRVPEAVENGLSHFDEPAKISRKVPERRNSGSSTSSRSSHKSKKPKLEPGDLKTKMPESDQQSQESQNLPFVSYASHTSEPTPAGTSCINQKAETDPLLFIQDDRLELPDYYIHKAKELKHEADKMVEKSAKLVPYIKSILYFILWGHTMEKQNNNETSRIFTMYSDTHSLLQYVSRCRTANTGNHEPKIAEREKKLSVLILRMQSLLCLKLYNLKKAEAMKFKQIIDHDTGKAASSLKISTHAPSPHQNSWNKNSTGTPSPMSPTPSPTCSIGSVGSQGSCEQTSSKLSNGVSGASMSSPGMVTVPQRIHTVTQKYVTVTSYLVQCHDLWDQSALEADPYRDFFNNLDNRCGPLSLHSSMLHLVQYVYAALKEVIGP